MMKKQMFPLVLLLSLSAGNVAATTVHSDPFLGSAVIGAENAPVITKVVEDVIVPVIESNPFSGTEIEIVDQIITQVEEAGAEVVDNLELTTEVRDELYSKTSEVYTKTAENFSKVADWLTDKMSIVYKVGSEKAAEIYASKFNKTVEEVVVTPVAEDTVLVVDEIVTPVIEETVAPILEELVSVESQTAFSGTNQTIEEFLLEGRKSVVQDTTTDSWKTWASDVYTSATEKASNTANYVTDKSSDLYTAASEKASNGVSYVAGKSSDLHTAISDKVAGTHFETVFDKATCRPSVNTVGALTGASVFYNAAKKLKGNAFVKGLSSLTGAGLGAVSAPLVMNFIEGQVESAHTNTLVGLGALSVIGASFYLGKTSKKVATK